MKQPLAIAGLLACSMALAPYASGQGLPGETCSENGGINCPAVIPDGPGGVLVSTFGFGLPPGCNSVFISDVNVGVDIDHTWIGDLDVVVSGPDSIPLDNRGFGPDVVLFDRACGASDDMQAIWDDQGAPSPCPPVGFGRYLPLEPLSEMNSWLVPQTWQLTITDNAGGDIGTLVDWSIELTCEWGACCLGDGQCVQSDNYTCTFELDGAWQGDGTLCDEVQCGVPTMPPRWLGALLGALLALGLTALRNRENWGQENRGQGKSGTRTKIGDTSPFSENRRTRPLFSYVSPIFLSPIFVRVPDFPVPDFLTGP